MAETIIGFFLMLWGLFVAFVIFTLLAMSCAIWRHKISIKTEPLFWSIIAIFYLFTVVQMEDWLFEAKLDAFFKLPLVIWVLFGWAMILAHVSDMFRERSGKERYFDMD